jgi:hypothetical protein
MWNRQKRERNEAAGRQVAPDRENTRENPESQISLPWCADCITANPMRHAGLCIRHQRATLFFRSLRAVMLAFHRRSVDWLVWFGNREVGRARALGLSLSTFYISQVHQNAALGVVFESSAAS